MFEERPTSMGPTSMILVRVLVGKIADLSALAETLKGVPVDNSDPSWNCVEWIRTAVEAIARNSALMGTSNLDWETIRTTAMAYCKQKTDQGRFSTSGLRKVPTYDLLERKETIK